MEEEYFEDVSNNHEEDDVRDREDDSERPSDQQEVEDNIDEENAFESIEEHNIWNDQEISDYDELFETGPDRIIQVDL